MAPQPRLEVSLAGAPGCSRLSSLVVSLSPVPRCGSGVLAPCGPDPVLRHVSSCSPGPSHLPPPQEHQCPPSAWTWLSLGLPPLTQLGLTVLVTRQSHVLTWRTFNDGGGGGLTSPPHPRRRHPAPHSAHTLPGSPPRPADCQAGKHRLGSPQEHWLVCSP